MKTRYSMKPRLVAFRSSLLMSVFLTATLFVSQAEANQVTTISDQSRLVSIGGAVTEIIYALGKGDELIGRDSTSTYPEEANKIDDVGYMRQLSPEGVLSLNPSAIIMIDGSGPLEAVDVINKSSVAVVSVPDDYTAEGVFEKIGIIGKAIGAEEQADALITKVKADFAELEQIKLSPEKQKKILFLLSLQSGRLTASGTGTAADGIIKLAGGLNAIDSFKGYKQLTDEAIEKLAPDFILLMHGDGDHAARREEVLQMPAIALTPAGQNKNIIMMDGLYLLSFGPRTGQAAKELSQYLYSGH